MKVQYWKELLSRVKDKSHFKVKEIKDIALSDGVTLNKVQIIQKLDKLVVLGVLKKFPKDKNGFISYEVVDIYKISKEEAPFKVEIKRKDIDAFSELIFHTLENIESTKVEDLDLVLNSCKIITNKKDSNNQNIVLRLLVDPIRQAMEIIVSSKDYPKFDILKDKSGYIIQTCVNNLASDIENMSSKLENDLKGE